MSKVGYIVLGCIVGAYLAVIQPFTFLFNSCGVPEESGSHTTNSSSITETNVDQQGLKFELLDSQNEYQVIGYTLSLVKNVTIPSSFKGLPVTKIANGAFAMTAIQKVVIPSTVSYIGESAFSSCDELLSVQLNEGLKYIGRIAFSHTALSGRITIPATVTDIGEMAFTGAKDITEIVFADTNHWYKAPMYYELDLFQGDAADIPFVDWDAVSVLNASYNAERMTSETVRWSYLKKFDV